MPAAYRYEDRGRWVETISDDRPAPIMNPGSCTYQYAGIHDHTSLDDDAADRLVHDTEVETAPDSRPSRVPRIYQYDCAR